MGKAPAAAGDVLISSGGTPSGVGRKLAGLSICQRNGRVGQSVEQLATLWARERELAALIRRAAGGDEAALAALYDATSSLVYSLALRMLRDQSAAEEVTLEVYMQAYRQASSYDPGRGTPSAWLVTLTRSRAIDRLRADSRRQKREESLAMGALLSTHTADPEECSAETERRRIVSAALEALSVEQRQVIEIAYYAGLSHTEIAIKLGLPLGAVKTRLRTAMIVLRDHMRPLLAEGKS